MSYRRTIFITAGCAGTLLLLRITMAARAAVWAAENRVLSLPQRLLIAGGEAAHFLIIPLLAIGCIAWWLGRRPR